MNSLLLWIVVQVEFFVLEFMSFFICFNLLTKREFAASCNYQLNRLIKLAGTFGEEIEQCSLMFSFDKIHASRLCIKVPMIRKNFLNR